MLEEEKVSHDTTNKIAKLVLKEFENILPFMSLISCAKYLHPNPRSLKMHKLFMFMGAESFVTPPKHQSLHLHHCHQYCHHDQYRHHCHDHQYHHHHHSLWSGRTLYWWSLRPKKQARSDFLSKYPFHMQQDQYCHHHLPAQVVPNSPTIRLH